MFEECSKLKEIQGINDFNTRKVTTIEGMFCDCSEIEFLDLSNFDTSNIVNMASLFEGYSKLKEIKGINGFITDNVIDMKAMFKECSCLEYLNLSIFNTSKVKDMSFMFYKCDELKYLNILNFSINCKT